MSAISPGFPGFSPIFLYWILRDFLTEKKAKKQKIPWISPLCFRYYSRFSSTFFDIINLFHLWVRLTRDIDIDTITTLSSCIIDISLSTSINPFFLPYFSSLFLHNYVLNFVALSITIIIMHRIETSLSASINRHFYLIFAAFSA